MLSRRVEKNTLVPRSDLTLLFMSIFSGRLMLHAGRQLTHIVYFPWHISKIVLVDHEHYTRHAAGLDACWSLVVTI